MHRCVTQAFPHMGMQTRLERMHAKQRVHTHACISILEATKMSPPPSMCLQSSVISQGAHPQDIQYIVKTTAQVYECACVCVHAQCTPDVTEASELLGQHGFDSLTP